MMEKGSFHISESPASVQEADELVKRIPLPNQLPNGIDFTNIPAPALRSGTLENLISQNEDLMARLNVSLRRTNQLEERAAVLERDNSNLRARFESLHEQFQVLQEKDRLTSARTQALHDETGAAKSAAKRIEQVYADLYVQAQAFQRRLVHLERYRARIRRAAKSVQTRAKRALELEEDRKNLMVSHMQTVNSFEAKLSEAKQQIEELRMKAIDRDKAVSDKIRIENQLVFEQRQHAQKRSEDQREIDRLANESTQVRVQLKEVLVTNESQRLDLARLQDEIPDLQEECKTLRDQVESLQALWAHKQRELDQLEEKNRNLQRLNQTLSSNLNVQRKEALDTKTEAEREAFVTREKIRALETENELLRQQSHPPIATN